MSDARTLNKLNASKEKQIKKFGHKKIIRNKIILDECSFQDILKKKKNLCLQSLYFAVFDTKTALSAKKDSKSQF